MSAGVHPVLEITYKLSGFRSSCCMISWKLNSLIRTTKVNYRNPRKLIVLGGDAYELRRW